MTDDELRAVVAGIAPVLQSAIRSALDPVLVRLTAAETDREALRGRLAALEAPAPPSRSAPARPRRRAPVATPEAPTAIEVPVPPEQVN
jgi:hypothetical protein